MGRGKMTGNGACWPSFCHSVSVLQEMSCLACRDVSGMFHSCVVIEVH